MVINKIILKNTKLKEVSIPYPESPGCGASFLLENRVPPPICPSYLPYGGDSIISTLCLCDIVVCSLKSRT